MTESEHLVWRRIDAVSTEYCELARTKEGWFFSGVVVLVHESSPWLVRYTVHTDGDWRTKRALIRAQSGAEQRSRTISVDGEGRWWSEKEEHPQVQGAIDIDLAFTPATNTLPIRRAALEVGQTAEVTAAWIRFPSLDVEPLPQRYVRLAEKKYRYESGGGAFSAELDVDASGLVERYGGLWERVRA
jgi:hypothetical protein